MDIRRLRYFVAVAEAGTVTEAARCLHIAQPSLSQQIRALERTIGAPLFRRRPQGMELTDSGTALLEGVHRAFHELRSAIATARSTPRSVTLGVCLGVPDDVLTRVERLLAASTGSRITLRQTGSAEQVRHLCNGGLDLGLLRLPVDRSELEVRVVSDEPLGVVLATDHPLAARPSLTWTDLISQRLLWFPADRAPEYSSIVLDQLADLGWCPTLVTDDHSSHTLFRRSLRTHHELVALRPESAIGQDPELVWRPCGPNAPHERLALAALRTGPLAQQISFVDAPTRAD